MKALLNLACLFLGLTALPAGFGADAPTLKPPPGVKVVIVMFEDMECPSCAYHYSMVEEAGKNHKVPVLLRDFPLGANHPWSFDAAVWARFFDTKSEAMGHDFRAYIFKSQPQINPGNLRQYVQKFADDNHVPLPFAYDPEGKLKAMVQADRELGINVGVKETPTVFVVSNKESKQVAKLDPDTLSQTIEEVQKNATPAPTPAKTAAKKKAGTTK